MAASAREVLLVGSVPLTPAAAVFETVAHHLKDLVLRIPDGEQIGWGNAVRRSIERHDAFEVSGQVAMNAGGVDLVDLFRLKKGVSPKDVTLGPYGYAENAINSYAAFKRLRDEGTIAASTRYQMTLPGPGTSTCYLQIPAEDLLPMARKALLNEIERALQSIPADDLTIQIDVGMEAEHEEYLRRPQAFDQPIHTKFHWTMDQMAGSVAWLANHIPDQVEVGFHICSIWHHNPSAGQDNQVLVDVANAILGRVQRPIGYLHIPIIPEHSAEDFQPLEQLELRGATLYLGLINVADGIEGAKKRIAFAEAVVSDFGVASFCGLGRPFSASSKPGQFHRHPPIPALRRATPETIGAVLDLHRSVALAS
jgi:hypothetical protein